MAAFRLACKGKSLADSCYDAEVKSITAFLSLQQPGTAPAISEDKLDIHPDDYLAPRFLKRIRSKVRSRRF